MLGKDWDTKLHLMAGLDPEATENQARADEKLAKFNKHRTALLEILREAYDRGPKRQAFNVDYAWSNMQFIAITYIEGQTTKQQKMSPAERAACFRAIGDTLTKARRMIAKAMGSVDLAADLTWGWWEVKGGKADAETQFVLSPHVKKEFVKAFRTVAALEMGAIRAGEWAHRKRGRPKGTSVFAPEYIDDLAQLYKENTGLKPGAGHGAFANYVRTFLEAVSRSLDHDSVVESIKAARRRALARRVKWAPSAFED